MNNNLKNPLAAFAAGLLILWLVYYLLKVALSLFGLIVLVFIVLFFVNDRFRHSLQLFFSRLFSR